MEQKLTKRQKQIYDILLSYMEDSEGVSPTLPELMELSGISTKKGVASHLSALERKGYIQRTGEARGIRLLLDDSGDLARIPLIGYANAGEPLIEAEDEFHGELMVERKFLRGRRKVFGVELRGDSMELRVVNGVPMSNGNFVIVVKESEVIDGDAVLAVINDSATVKSLKKDKGMFILYPESSNPIHKPIYIKNDSARIVGKVITVLSNPTKEESKTELRF